MAVKCGPICFDGVEDAEDLKKHGIYCIGEDLDEYITNRKPLDYEFLLIDGSQDNLFIDAIKYLFNTAPVETHLNKLKMAIAKEFASKKEANEDSELNQGQTFEWLSRIIERMPGKIIIIGEELVQNNRSESNQEKTDIEEQIKDIQTWVKKRILWIKKEDINPEKTELSLPISKVKDLNSEKKLELRKLLLHANWLKIFNEKREFDFSLTLKIDETEEYHRKDIEGNLDKIILDLFRLKDTLDYSYDELKRILMMPFEVFLKSRPHALVEAIKNSSSITPVSVKNAINNMEYKGISENLVKIYRPSYEDFIKKFFELDQIAAHRLFSDRSTHKMPASYKLDGSKIQSNQERNFSLSSQLTGSEPLISYYRHGEIELSRDAPGARLSQKADGQTYHYYEALSGASPHYPIISSLNSEDEIQNTSLLLSLAENGLVKLLIADERIAKFMDSEEKKEELNNQGIWVLNNIQGLVEGADDIQEFIKKDGLFLNSFKDVEGEAEKDAFDFFIIHQGILDKLGDKVDLEKEINRWKKKYFPYVIITSGRGTPDNVPPNSKFLPFSNIETTLISRPISKFVLTRMLFRVIAK